MTSAKIKTASQPNATTMKAMKQADAIAKPRFSSAKELFASLEKGNNGKARKTSQEKR